MPLTHRLNLYQRPAQGGMNGTFLASFVTVGWSHVIKARGGFESATCSVVIPRARAEAFIAEYLGTVGRLFVDNPMEPAWEGFIESITYVIGGQAITRSLANMSNRTNVVFFDADAATPDTTSTGVANNTTSQSVWGIRETTLDAGIHYNTADKTHKTILRNTLLAVKAFPQITTTSSGGAIVLTLELRGLIYYAYEYQNYLNTGTTLLPAVNAFLRASVALAAPANAAQVVETSAVYPVTYDDDIVSNLSFNIAETSDTGQTHLQYINSVVEAGDGTQQWVWGIGVFNINTLTRRIYYREASTAVVYTANVLRDVGRIRDTTGKLIPGWKIRPDRGIRLNDVLVGYNQTGDDPRVGYIEQIQYDAETGMVSYSTGDNRTVEGALGVVNYFKRAGDRYTVVRNVT